MEYTLYLTFVNSDGDKTTLSISGVKAGVTKDDAITLMDTIIAKDVFESKGASLVSKYGAQLTQRQTTKLDL